MKGDFAYPLPVSIQQRRNRSRPLAEPAEERPGDKAHPVEKHERRARAAARMIGSSSTASSRSGWSKTYRSPSRVCASSMLGRDSGEAPTGAHNVSATGKRARLGEF